VSTNTPFFDHVLKVTNFPFFRLHFLNLCYTDIMQTERSLWQNWARFLQHWGIDGIAAYLMEAGGPLSILAAQAIYVGQPFLRQSMPEGHWLALADLFENHEEGHLFAAFLREGRNQ
jgi:hypothetical protein